MAQAASSSGKHHHSAERVGQDAHEGIRGEEPGGNARSAITLAHDTGRPSLRASSTTSTTIDISNVTSTTRSASHEDIHVAQPELLANFVTGSERAYAQSQEPMYQDENELHASAFQTGEAMKSDQLLTQWQKICSKQNRVKVELAGNKDLLSHLWAYDTFARKESLEFLKFRHLDFKTAPGVRQTGQCFHEHLWFLRQVIDNCNSLKKAGHAIGTLGIELPLFRPNTIMHDYEVTMAKIQLKIFLETLRADEVIVSLDLSGIRSDWFGLDILADYFASLATNTQLEALDLSGAELSDDDVRALDAALEKNSSIKSICLKDCATSEKGAEILAQIRRRRGAREESL